MAEQRSDDDNETIDRCVKELDNSGGDVITSSKVGDEEGLKAPLNVPKFGEWNDPSTCDGSDSYVVFFDKARKESRRDTNKLEYFSVSPFNVHGDDDLNGINGCGGGGGGGGARPRDHGILAEPKLEHHSGDAGAGDRSRQIQVGDGAGTKRGWWKKWFRFRYGRK
ncbi:hypothetical protein R6Q59_034497 [Mikania micrantha]|uniref:RIN4 pathogenic type III effector avirulence factor Avr cleavage site domain-containing protein n=1 Tax=Mikania micrantha TaxID=192012 RepID=A0A5N6NJ32_9ASTR|nr:hypothetical protein E3N88_20573 [Mikania micrantha]